MPRTAAPLRHKNLTPPFGGYAKDLSYQSQSPYTTAYCNNVVRFDQANGRSRIGTRPGLTAFSSSPSGTPYNWCEATWYNSGTKVGVAVTTSAGTYVWDGSTWTEFITTNVGNDFASCAVYNQTLFQATGGNAGGCLYLSLASSAGAGAYLSAHGSVDGTPPTNCGLVCAHGDRLALAGDTASPHVLYLSRVGQFYDWDYAETDAGAAVASSGSQGGIISEPITALKSHTRECLIVGCTDSMYVVRGTSRDGMQTEMLSNKIGPLMHSAWDHDAKGRLWMLTRMGLAVMDAGCGASPELVSMNALPDDMVAIDPGAGDHVSVVYDQRWNWLVISVDYASGTDVHYFYCLPTDSQPGAFFPFSSAQTFRLGVPVKRSMTTGKSTAVMLSASSSAFQFDRSSSESVDSYLAYGPILTGDQSGEGLLVDISAVPAPNSGDIACKIYGGNSASEAYTNLVADSEAFTCANWTIEGQNYLQQPKVGAHSVYVKAYDVSNADWAMEDGPQLTMSMRMPRRRVR